MNQVTNAEPENVASTQLITLDPERYVTAVFTPFKERFAKAKQEAAAVTTIDVTNGAGMKVAIGHRATFRLIRLEVEKARKARKEPILQIGKLLDSRAKEIEAEVTAEEERFDVAIKTEETRKEREKAEREAAEQARIAGIQARIAEVSNLPAKYVGKPSSEIDPNAANAYMPATWAQEFQASAENAALRAFQTLQQLRDGAKAQEDAAATEAKRLQDERAELAHLRAEQAERDRAAAAQAEQDRKRIEEENRLRAEQEAARAAKIEQEEKAARERIEAEQAAAKAARDEADRLAREKREEEDRIARAERAAREAEETAAKAARIAQEDAERREKAEAAAAAERTLQAEQARQQAEKTRLEAERREIERQQAELMDGDTMLRAFLAKFGKRKEYARIVTAIDRYFTPKTEPKP